MTSTHTGGARHPLLVLGIGNILLSDDGIGVRVVQALDGATGLPPETEVVDGGTQGLELLPLVATARALVVVDAVDVGAPPGSLHTYADDLLRATTGTHVTVHQVGLADMIGAARLTGVLPAHAVLIGIQVATTSLGLTLSPSVARTVPAAMAAVQAWCTDFHHKSLVNRHS
ncbi:hydrogenase maturation protease [Kutzneria albida]|uniref:Hydrogenase maturation protease n=1 Tax=Kutzneria albida DSM 43870 TaxID=1449976 RepID=W5W9B7_9PSEU|nr:hydrogenase maturation protease [Kutzneria albida]AHH97557.1 hypothetical protein KALB_4194 [Kutzneria albida DSM 43870]